MCLVFKISAYPFGQVKTKMYLPESPFFKKSLAGASELVLMSVPDDETLHGPCGPRGDGCPADIRSQGFPGIAASHNHT